MFGRKLYESRINAASKRSRKLYEDATGSLIFDKIRSILVGAFCYGDDGENARITDVSFDAEGIPTIKFTEDETGRFYFERLDEYLDAIELDKDDREFIEDYLKSCRHMRFNQVTVETLDFLDHVNDGNIDLYRELISGNYNIFKDDEYREMREDNNLYVKDIEIMERNVPIVLSLYKNYNIDTIKDIYKYCIDKKQNRINFSKLNRIRKFVSIEQSRRKRRLDFPILRFVKDAQKWADDIMKCTREEIDEWLKSYACKYANSVKDVVVEDKAYLEKIYDLICNLWKVIIDQSKPKNGIITIRPFEMLWDTKQEINEIYQNNITKQFFLQELIENIKIEDGNKKEETLEEYESKLPENLPHTSKYKLEQIESQLKNVIHDGYDYSDYASKDGTNKRFVEKMENTNSLRGTIFGQNLNKSEDTSYMKKVEEKNLFEDCPF